MPAKKRSSSGKKEGAKESPVANRRSTRAAASDSKSVASTKRKTNPSSSPARNRAASAKKGRTRSPSLAPNERPRRGRSTSRKEDSKQREIPARMSRSASSSQKGRVTRNLVQVVEVKKSADTKSRSAFQRAKSPAVSKGSADPKIKAVAPKRKAEAPKQKKETSKQKTSTKRSRSATPKHVIETPKDIAVTSKQKSAISKQRATEKQKQQTPKKKNEPEAKKNSLKSTPIKEKKPNYPPKTIRSRRSRQDVQPFDTEPNEKGFNENDEEANMATAEGVTDKNIENKTPEQDQSVDDLMVQADDEETNMETAEGVTDKNIENKTPEQDQSVDNLMVQADDEETNMETAEGVTDKNIENKTPQQDQAVDSLMVQAVAENKLDVEETEEQTVDILEKEIEKTLEAEKEEEGNRQKKEETDKETDGEKLLDNIEKENKSTDGDHGPEMEAHKAEETEHVEANANDNLDIVEDEMGTGDADEALQLEEEVSESDQFKVTQIESSSKEDETFERKQTKEIEVLDEVKSDEDAEIAIESEAVKAESKTVDSEENIVGNLKSSVTNFTETIEIASEKSACELVKKESEERGEILGNSEQGYFDKDAGEAVITQTESDTVNDAIEISGEEKDSGNGDQEQPNVAIVEEISDDDNELIDTKQENGAVNEDNGDIKEIVFVEQVDKYVENTPTKRKIDNVNTELDESSPVKRIRISTEEELQENGSTSQEDLAKDFVIIEMGDIPEAGSTEVQNSLPNPIFNRTFIPNPTFSGSTDSSKQFSIVSYNMLADCHLFRNDYSFTEAKFLQPEYRLKKVIEELRFLDGDIVCMQEVDPQFFADELLPNMRSLGYEGVHKQREHEYYNEGEATFFKTSRFDVVETEASTFSELLKKELEGIEPEVQEAVKKYTNLPDVLIVAKLQCKNTGRDVTIGNVHIHWGEMKVPDAQCVQIASAVKEIVSKATGDNFPHIICGDFNSPPMSPGYLVARDGYPSGDETINTLMKIEGLEFTDGKTAALVNSLWPAFQHTSSSLRSAYSEAQGYEPEISSYNRVMCECVDYIFYSSMSLENVGVLQTSSKEKIMETGGIPNCYFPSDHVSLKSVFSFK